MAQLFPPPGTPVFLYASHSDHKKSGDDFLDRQKTACREIARKNGWSIIGEFWDVDPGGDGGLPDFQRMIDLVADGRAQAIVIESHTQLPLKSAKLHTWYRKLKGAGVVIVTTDGRVLGGLELSIHLAIAENDWNNHSARVKRGLERRRQKLANMDGHVSQPEQ